MVLGLIMTEAARVPPLAGVALQFDVPFVVLTAQSHIFFRRFIVVITVIRRQVRSKGLVLAFKYLHRLFWNKCRL
jgi:hypothetical protein